MDVIRALEENDLQYYRLVGKQIELLQQEATLPEISQPWIGQVSLYKIKGKAINNFNLNENLKMKIR